ncbi:MAG: PspC domain-containing protein [Bacteroidota bacterium]
MNKTVTVNIGGMVFHIEELAYEKMKKYLEAIRGYFTSSDGRDEIIQDIESRMAEMFSERLGTARQVVTDDDVEHVINNMGRPEQVAGEDEDNNARAKAEGKIPYTAAERSAYRRLYRDADDKVIGGVCSGFSHYIGTDPIWLRLVFAASVFISFGTTLLVYIILVLIIPKAQSTAEKLEMKGQPVNINTIKKTLEEEVQDIKQRMGDNPFRVSSSKSAVARFFEGLGEILIVLIRFIGKAFLFLILFVIFLVLIALFMGSLTVAGLGNFSDIPDGAIDFLLSPSQRWLVIISAVLVLGIPLLMLIYKLIKLVFNIKSENRYLNMSFGILIAIGLIFGIYTASDISREFREKESVRQNIPIAQPGGNTIYLDLLDNESYRDESYYNHNWRMNSDFSISDLHDDTLYIDNVKVDVVRSSGNEFELMQIISSRGKDRKMAMNHARRVNFKLVQQDSLIKIGKNYQIVKGDKFRGQKVQLVLKVPIGKSVHLGRFIDDIIYDIKNVTNTWDRDMVGKTWTMTENGLECVGCNLENTSSDNDNEKVKVKVNGKTISVGTDKDTINWDNKDVKIRIDGDGVVIDAKDNRK